MTGTSHLGPLIPEKPESWMPELCFSMVYLDTTHDNMRY
jgi:hypothetical protein